MIEFFNAILETFTGWIVAIKNFLHLFHVMLLRIPATLTVIVNSFVILPEYLVGAIVACTFFGVLWTLTGKGK